MVLLSDYTQRSRLIQIDTPLGRDALLLLSFNGREELSRLFRYDLVTISERDDIKARDLVGKNISFSVERADGSRRHFNGHVRRLIGGAKELAGFRTYSLEVVPWLWFLTRTADCRIFQKKTVIEIFEEIFRELGFKDFENDIRGNHPKRDYCVQYRESDFNFVSRLMEEEGIFYYFRHEEGRHSLILADHAAAYGECDERTIRYSPGTTSLVPDHITSWDRHFEFRSGKWTHTDYNFETPTTDLTSDSPTLVDVPDARKYELFDYPGEYAQKSEGKDLARIRMQEEEASHDVAQAESGCRTLHPGHVFALTSHDSEFEDRDYLITAIEHDAHSGTYTTEESGDEYYRNGFTCIPDDVIFRPARITPKPTIVGSQTAVVVGPSSEEIHTDEHGRIKVQFHWDRLGGKDQNSSCWIRVRQDISGSQWGAMYIPRIGQEVIVEFLEGDPDKPLVTGCVYNADMKPPWALPDNKNRSGFESRSTKGGAKANANMLGFDDTKGEETVVLHAEKDAFREVENDDHVLVEHDQKINVKNNRDAKIEDGHDTLTVAKGNRTAEISQGDDSLTIKMGNRSTKISLGADKTEAMKSIELVVGPSSIKITPSDITLKAMNITVQGQIKTDVTGVMTTVKGTGILTLQGGLIKIN